MKSRKKLRVVILGAGQFGSKRIDSCIRLNEDFQITGIIDPSNIQRKRIEKLYHVPTGKSFTDLSAQADLAIIATPNIFHADLSIQALKRGLHVLCENPLATNLPDAQRVIDTAKKCGRFIKIGANHRYFQTILKAKELYDQGAIGKVLLFRASIGIEGERLVNTWFTQPETSGGGTFIDNGYHLVDLARTFMGDFSSCLASMSKTYWKTKVEDVASAIFLTADNRQAIINSSWIQWAGYIYIELWGSKGYLIIESNQGDRITFGTKDGNKLVFDYTNQPKNSGELELLYLKNCLDQKIAPNPSGEDALKVVSMIEKAYQSSQKKIWVPIK